MQKLKGDNVNFKIIAALKYIIYNKINNGEEVEQKTCVPITKNGIPQGLSFSPLIACYYALEIDDIYSNDKDVVGFRYIDDMMVLGKNKQDLKKVYRKIKKSQINLK